MLVFHKSPSFVKKEEPADLHSLSVPSFIFPAGPRELSSYYGPMIPFQKVGNGHDRIIIGKMFQIPCNQNRAAVFCNLIKFPVCFIHKRGIYWGRYYRAS